MQTVSSPLQRMGAAKDGWRQGRETAARVATATTIRVTYDDTEESLCRFMMTL
jgi:hypothetical protein